MKNLIREFIAMTLLQYHRFNKPKTENILSIYFHNPTVKVFSNIIQYLNENNYKVVTLDELSLSISNKKKKDRLAIITFDDGWLKNLDLVKLILKYNIPVAIFVTTDAVTTGNFWFEFSKIPEQEKLTSIQNSDDFKKLPVDLLFEKILAVKSHHSLDRSCLTVDDIQYLKTIPLVTIGSHTVKHPILSNCSIQRQTMELKDSKLSLEKWSEGEIKYIAYPNGDYDQNTINISKQTGYKLGFTNIPGRIDVKNINPYLIPRNCVDDNCGFYESIAKALGIWQIFFPKKIHKIKLKENKNILNPVDRN